MAIPAIAPAESIIFFVDLLVPEEPEPGLPLPLVDVAVEADPATAVTIVVTAPPFRVLVLVRVVVGDAAPPPPTTVVATVPPPYCVAGVATSEEATPSLVGLQIPASPEMGRTPYWPEGQQKNWFRLRSYS
jgi:hypothetical protein